MVSILHLEPRTGVQKPLPGQSAGPRAKSLHCSPASLGLGSRPSEQGSHSSLRTPQGRPRPPATSQAACSNCPKHSNSLSRAPTHGGVQRVPVRFYLRVRLLSGAAVRAARSAPTAQLFCGSQEDSKLLVKTTPSIIDDLKSGSRSFTAPGRTASLVPSRGQERHTSPSLSSEQHVRFEASMPLRHQEHQ